MTDNEQEFFDRVFIEVLGVTIASCVETENAIRYAANVAGTSLRARNEAVVKYIAMQNEAYG